MFIHLNIEQGIGGWFDEPDELEVPKVPEVEMKGESQEREDSEFPGIFTPE